MVMKFLPPLSSAVRTNNTTFLPASAPSEQAAQLAVPLEGGANLTNLTIAIVNDRGKLDAADFDAIGQLENTIKHVPHVVLVRPSGVSPNRQAAQLFVLSNVPKLADHRDKVFVDAVQSAIDRQPLPPGLHAYPAGILASQVASQSSTTHTSKRIQLFAVLFIVVLLLIVFRSVLAPLVTLLPAFLVAQVSGPLIAEASKVGVPVSSITQFMLIVIVLGAGTDYGLFLVFRVREELRRGHSSKEAVSRALARVGESITFSAATVIGALASLALASFGIYRSLGIPLAIGIGLMLLAGLTLLPALLAILGRAVFWPANVKPQAERIGVWGRVAAWVVRKPAPTLLVGVVVFGGLAIASIGNRPAGFGNSLSAPSGSAAATGNAILAHDFPRVEANPANVLFVFNRSVWDDPTVLATAQRDLERSGEFKSVFGPLDPIGISIPPSDLTTLFHTLGPPGALPVAKLLEVRIPVKIYDAYRADAQLVSSRGHTVQYETSLAAGPASSSAALNAVPKVRAAIASVAHRVGAIKYGLGGEAAGAYDVSHTSSEDLLHIVPLVVVIIALLLILVLRSLIAPLYLIASVVISYLAALGFSVVVFMYILGASGLTFILPFLMFLFLLALGEDYNILVMTRIREESHTYDVAEAVSRAVSRTGTTVTSAGLILAGTFTVLALAAGSGAGGSEIRDIGFGLAIGVLMDTFVVRSLLVPSMVVLLGRFSWWPSKLAKDIVLSDPEITSEKMVEQDAQLLSN